VDQVRKAMDSLQAANYERRDLSALISLQDGPIRPLLQAQSVRGGTTAPAIGEVPAKGKTHYWDEQALVAPTGATAGYQEGGKPVADFGTVAQITNVVGRFGKVAAVTDTMAAVWTGAGSYQLQEGELQRLYQQALDFDTELKTMEVLNEIEWSMVQGNSANNTAASIPASPSAASGSTVTSQFNGLLEILAANNANTASFTGSAATGYGASATLVNANAAPYSSNALIEQMVRDVAQKMAQLKTPYMPNLMLCTSGQLEIINSWRPSIITQDTDGLTGGASVSYYNTGFSKVKIEWEPQLPSGYLVITNTALLKRANLIRLGAEPLARVQTQVERMITCEMSLEIRVQKAHGILYNLPY
jgi:Family of unknown function (DUF5309)